MYIVHLVVSFIQYHPTQTLFKQLFLYYKFCIILYITSFSETILYLFTGRLYFYCTDAYNIIFMYI